MDLNSSVRTDSLPAIATLVLPGAVALSPWLYLLFTFFPSVLLGALDHQAIAVATILLSTLLAGLAVESAGSYVEVYWIDRQSDDAEARRINWNAYLRMKASANDECIGHRYIRRTLISFKFELNMFVALFPAWFGVAFLGFYRLIGSFTMETLISIALLMWLCFVAARDSAEVLASVRATLVDGHPELVEKARAFVERRL